MMDERLSGIGGWLDASVPVPERESSEHALRQGVLAGAERLGQKRRRARITMVSAAVAASVLVTFGATRWMGENRQAAIQFRVLPSTDPGRIGAYVAPTGDAPLDIKFTEGSVVELNPGARARVAATTARGATVLLETGRAAVDVVHRDRADWTIMAGPYSVRVHGTAFTVEFDPKTQMFDLVMRSGVVTVEGPGISQPVEIRGAQRFVHRAGLGSEITEVRNQQRELDLPSAPQVKEVPLAAGPEVGAAVANPSPANGHRATTWEGQVKRGEYSAVIREAERRGIPQVLATATAPEIMALANAARFSGRSSLGRDAYKALRQRFVGSPVAASAAFLMGRMTESSPQEARRWYERYEQEAPRGALVAEAMGRRLLLTQATGSRSDVQRLAEEYVRRFPEGPYAGVARKIVAP
ncbi:MAG TPA: FecR domain-containing protein [Polyangiaceae bacterium]|nr:FecR domain-containing protein [Polyangiaceae bacterium]